MLYWAPGVRETIKGSFIKPLCRSLWGPSSVISGAPPHRRGNLRASSHVIGCDRAAVCSHSQLTHCVFGPRGLVAAWVGAGRLCLHRVTPLPSSPYLCFPCKVWGFSKQTGGDKHMLWTALRWVVSEVQQSRSLSGCGYTSHSEVDGRTGALLLYHR